MENLAQSVAQPSPLDLAAQQYREAKAAEAAARDRRIAAEEAIIGILGVKEEGTTSEKTDYFTVKTVGKLNRTLDTAAWEAVRGDVPDGLAPIEYKPALDLKRLRALETANPKVYAIVAAAIVTKPAKPAVSVDLLEG